MIYADGGHEWIDEDHLVDHYPIARGNHAAEANAHRFADAGGTATVLRFGVFYGRGAAHSEQILELARHHIGFAAGRPDSYVSSIHLADAADAIVAALGCAGGTTTSSMTNRLPNATTRRHAPTRSEPSCGSRLPGELVCS